jgi:N-acylneuraminate cytidylyltransferase
MSYVVKKYLKLNMKFDEIWLIYATNPFITSKIILECNKIFNKNMKRKALMTVTKYNYPPEWALEIKNNGILKPSYPEKLKIRSQDLEEKYCDAGMVIAYPSNFFYKKNFVNLNYIPFILPLDESVDIDNIQDFNRAKKLLSK